jgi:hypothetical protein
MSDNERKKFLVGMVTDHNKAPSRMTLEVFQRITQGEGSRNQLVLQLVTEVQGGSDGTRYQDDNQDRSEVLGTLEAVLYTGRSVSKYSTEK